MAVHWGSMGRKKLPPERAREKPLRIRLNADERRLVDEAANAEGYRNTSAWARMELLQLKIKRRSRLFLATRLA
jgi:hypothetical protein